MTPLDIGEIIFLVIVVVIGLGGLIKVALFSKED